MLTYIFIFVILNVYSSASIEEIEGGNMLELSVVTSKGQVTIPAFMREKYGIKAGDKIIWEDSENKIALRKPQDFFSLRGCLGKVEIPEDEEELFADAVVEHVMKDC